MLHKFLLCLGRVTSVDVREAEHKLWTDRNSQSSRDGLRTHSNTRRSRSRVEEGSRVVPIRVQYNHIRSRLRLFLAPLSTLPLSL